MSPLANGDRGLFAYSGEVAFAVGESKRVTLFPETSIAGNEKPASVSSRAVAGDATLFFRETERFGGEGVDLPGVDASFFALRSSLDRRSRNRSISSSLALSLAESAESAARTKGGAVTHDHRVQSRSRLVLAQEEVC